MIINVLCCSQYSKSTHYIWTLLVNCATRDRDRVTKSDGFYQGPFCFGSAWKKKIGLAWQTAQCKENFYHPFRFALFNFWPIKGN